MRSSTSTCRRSGRGSDVPSQEYRRAGREHLRRRRPGLRAGGLHGEDRRHGLYHRRDTVWRSGEVDADLLCERGGAAGFGLPGGARRRAAAALRAGDGGRRCHAAAPGRCGAEAADRRQLCSLHRSGLAGAGHDYRDRQCRDGGDACPRDLFDHLGGRLVRTSLSRSGGKDVRHGLPMVQARLRCDARQRALRELPFLRSAGGDPRAALRARGGRLHL